MNIKIADRLVELRKKNGFSQEQLAEKLGLSRQAVSKWERAEASPDTDNLICLAKIYNVSLDELLDTDQSIEEIAQETKEKEERISYQKDDEDHDLDDQMSPNNKLVVGIVSGLTSVIVLLTYILLGVYLSAWGTAWPLFFLIAVIPSIFEAIFCKSFKKFLYPIVITAIYCTLGTMGQLWHPFWFLFLTIPAYYIIFNPIDTYIHRNDSK